MVKPGLIRRAGGGFLPSITLCKRVAASDPILQRVVTVVLTDRFVHAEAGQ
jgi:hypothetical protein